VNLVAHPPFWMVSTNSSAIDDLGLFLSLMPEL
jgi:hypothetical protein